MKIKAQRVSRRSDNGRWCRPSDGYDEDSVEIERDEYVTIDIVTDDLPPNNLSFPQGAPIFGTYKVGQKIMKKKVT